MLSFIIPAHNEERWIAACIGSIRAAMENIAEPYEVIVVDDASTDATHEIAEQCGSIVRAGPVVRGSPDPAPPPTAGLQSATAPTLTPGLQSLRVLRVDLRKISAVRNAGARAAAGDILFFIDADTQANEPAIRAALGALRAGASGGGCAPAFDDPMPRWARIIIWISVKIARRIRLVGGCFQFCTRGAYNEIGGYNENLRAGEDIAFCQAIKKIGRFAVPGPPVITSARKLNVVTAWQLVALLATIAIRGPRYESPWIIDILYGNRAQACKNPDEH
jgi:glycosyltransferase involved in cell wall biosynthesis